MKQKISFQNHFIFLIPILLLCLLVILLLICGLVFPPQYGDTFLGEMKYKYERLVSTEGKRIVFVGGSNIPFGLKSSLVEQAFPEYTVVDFGMYADMGTVIMLDLVKKEIHEGDIFIIMPEQNAQTLSCDFSGEDLWQAADGAFHLLTSISAERYERLFAAFPAFAGKKLSYAIHGAPSPDGIYARASFDEYGDISYRDRNANIMATQYNPNDPISFSSTMISEDFILELNDFAKEITEKGADVYYHFPPMNAKALSTEATTAQIDAYYAFLTSKIDFPILGNPHLCLMEPGWFYDTNYHLNESGSIVFTAQLIDDLKLLFGDTSRMELSLPAIPDQKALSIDGDDSCTDCFTYLHKDCGYLIDHLTEKGKQCSSLILPTKYKGEPVIGLSETLFVNDTSLEELIVQPNIGILYDGMFQGCTNFKKLILTGDSPSVYTVGEHLQEGAEFLISIPEDVFDDYCRHYTWHIYSPYFISE